MTRDCDVLLFQEIEPPAVLVPLVLARIIRARRDAARLRLAVSGIIALASVLALIPAVQYVASEFYTSGFYEYAALFFDSLSRGYWREILYSLTDSLPSLALIILASIGATCIWSLRQAHQNARVAFTRVILSA